MELINLVIEYGGWSWIVAGFILLGLELTLPGGVIVWFGVAAVLVGVATLIRPFGWQVQWALFAVLAVTCVMVWTRYFRTRLNTSDRPFLNARHQKYIGQVFTLDEPIVDGVGRLKVEDSFWRVNGPDLQSGARVKVIDAEPTILCVEAVG